MPYYQLNGNLLGSGKVKRRMLQKCRFKDKILKYAADVIKSLEIS